MKMLLLGGTSFFGKDIARLFHEEGYDVTLFTRGNARPSDLPPHRHFGGDRNDPEALRKAAADGPWDVVIDNIGYDAPQMRLAMEAFRGRTGRFLFCSTVSVYRFVRDPFPQPLEEEAVDYDWVPPAEDPGDVHWKYARGKLDAERVVREEKKIAWTILRPPVVYGPWDTSRRGFWYLERLLLGKPLLLADGGVGSFRLADSVDTARAFLLAARTKSAIGSAYNLAHSEVITLREFVEEAARALEISPTVVSAPLEILGDLSGPFATMTNFIPNIARIKKELGFRPTPWTECARRTAVWYRDVGRAYYRDHLPSLLQTLPEEEAFSLRWEEALRPFARRRPI